MTTLGLAAQSPFKGLSAFDDSERDALLFFGRERETEIVVANVLASRLTVLYGPSGVGKSSLLRAGVVQQLRRLGETEPLAVAIFSGWAADPVDGVEEAARAAIADALGGDPGDAPGGLADRLDAWTAALGGELCLVLDQLDELFLYHPRGVAFADELPELVTRPRLRVNVLLGIRDDALARLDVFKARIPGLFANSLGLDRLDREAGKRAVLGPLDRWNAAAGADEAVEIEPLLLEAILTDVAVGRIEPGVAGRGSVAESEAAQRIETPYLQLVLQRLWDVERERSSRTLRLSTFQALGGAQQIVEEHLDRAMRLLTPAQQDAAAGMFDHLVTPSGAKIAHAAGDLAAFAAVDAPELEPVLGALARERILRPLGENGHAGERYEIYHDVLGSAVLGWRARHETERVLAEERAVARRRHRRLAIVAGVALVALALTTALAVYAFAQRGRADDRAQVAKARELTLASLSQEDEDPALSLLLALEAARVDKTPAVENALRSALYLSRGRRVLDRGTPLRAAALVDGRVVTAAATRDGGSAAFSPDGRLLATTQGRKVTVRRGRATEAELTLGSQVVRVALAQDAVAAAGADGVVVVARVPGGSEVFRTRLTGRPTALALSRDGRRVAMAAGKSAVVFALPEARRIARFAGRSTVLGSALSPDHTTLATGAADGAVRLWNIPNHRLADVFRGHVNLVRALAFSPDGDRLVSGSADRKGRVWRTLDGHEFAVLAGHADEVESVWFNPDGTRAVTASADGTARVWDARGDPTLAVLRRFERPPRLMRVTSDAALVRFGDDEVAVSRDGGQVIRRRPAPSPASTLGGWRVAIDGPVVRLSKEDRRLVLRGHSDDVTSVRLSPDGSRIITASLDHDVRIWDAETGAPLRVIKAHVGRVADARYSPDGRWIVTAGPSAGVWDAMSGELLFYLGGHEGPLTGSGFAPDSRTIVTTGVDGTVRTYRCALCGGLDSLIPIAERRLAASGRTLTPGERQRFLRQS